MTDAVYDTTELVFIALLLFLTPLSHKSISEKHPFGYFQIESVRRSNSFSTIWWKSCRQRVNFHIPVILGIASVIIFMVMKRMSRDLSSPTIHTELLGWKLDIAYSLGMSLAFSLSLYLEKTALTPLAPDFDQIVAVIIMAFVLPESVKVLWRAVKDIFLLLPDKELAERSKGYAFRLWRSIVSSLSFYLTKTSRRL